MFVRALALLLPVAAALGQYLLPLNIAGVSIYAYRVIVALATPILWVIVRFRITLSKSSGFFLAAMYVWVLWGSLGVVWTPETATGIAEVLTVVFGIFAALAVILALHVEENAIEDLRRGWTLAYIVTALVAVWELRSGSHLSGAWVDTVSAYAQRGVVLSTFGNPNNYAAFLVLAFPFLAWSVAVSRGIWRLINILSAMSTPIFLILTGGRLAMLAIVVELVLLLIMQGKSLRSVAAMCVTGAILLGAIFAALQLDPRTLDKILRLREELQGGGSAAIRLNLAKNGLVFLSESYGLGAGPGSFEHLMLAGAGHYPTERIVNPHNFWIEILAQYGVLVFGIFVAALVFAGLKLLKATARRATNQQFTWARAAALSTLLAYLFAAVENSRFIPQPTNWVLLGTVVGIAGWIQEH